jgi:thioesterase domain-containing protein
LGEDQPFYGLQAQGLDGESPFLTTIEKMAELYVREIRKVQPHGPYAIGGYCMGGTVAYEIAQRLRAAGEEIGLVALLDTYNFNRALSSSKGSIIRQKLKFHLGNLAGLGAREAMKYVGEKLRVARDGELANLFANREGIADDKSSGVEKSITAVNESASTMYQPAPLAAKVAVFKPSANYDCYPDPLMGWGDLARNLEIIDLQVNPHAMLVEPYVKTLASELRQRLDALGGSRGKSVVAPKPERNLELVGK